MVSPQNSVRINGQNFSCTIGRSGFSSHKTEGDGTTPLGVWFPRCVFYRSDRIARPRTLLPVRTIHLYDGWCDSPTDRLYNQFIHHPFRSSAEHLWRDDSLYDLILVINHNQDPIHAFSGSAVFIHIHAPDFSPTAGCIGLNSGILRALIPKLTLQTPLYFGQEPLRSFSKWI